MLFDFHIHTVLSDGTLTPLEAGRRAHQSGCRVIALTDHVGVGSLERVINELVKDCEILSKESRLSHIKNANMELLSTRLRTD